MPSKINKTNQVSKEIIDVSKLNINEKLTGGAKKETKIINDSETESELEESEVESSEESNIDEQISSDDDRDIDEEQDEEQVDEEISVTEDTEETDKETDADEKTNRESDNESKEDEEEDNEENNKDKCYQKFSKKTSIDTDIDYDEYFIKDDEIIINKTGRLTKPYLTKYEKVRILGDRARQLVQGAKPMIKNTTGLSHKEVALLELKNKVIPLIIERPIPNVGVEKWKLSELEINL
jgi:DNA-directed RNA polymerase I, II, and III subunit RPABC2